MKIWLLYPVLLASSGLLIFVVRCVLGLLAKHPPKMRAMRGVPRRRLAAFLPLVVVLAIFASIKNTPHGGGILNVPLRLMQQFAGDPPGSRQFTADEKAALFVLQSVDTNAEWSAAKPQGAAEPTAWPATGAFADKYENLSPAWTFAVSVILP